MSFLGRRQLSSVKTPLTGPKRLPRARAILVPAGGPRELLVQGEKGRPPENRVPMEDQTRRGQLTQTPGGPGDRVAWHQALLPHPQALLPMLLPGPESHKAHHHLPLRAAGGGAVPLRPVPRPKLNSPLCGPQQLCVGTPSRGSQDTDQRGNVLQQGKPAPHSGCRPRRLSPGRSTRTTRAPSWCCCEMLSCSFICTSRQLLLVAWNQPDSPYPTTQAEHPQLPFLPGKQETSLTHLTCQCQKARHTAGECPSGKAVYSPRTQPPFHLSTYLLRIRQLSITSKHENSTS